MTESSEFTPSSTSACLERVQQGDEAAARELVQRMHPLVMKMIRSHLPARESEQDLEQKVFIKMFQNLHQYKAQVPFEHWLSRIAINTCINQIRSEKSRNELRWADLSLEQQGVIETLSTSDKSLDVSFSVSSRDLVDKLLGCLAPQDRLLMTLLYLEGHTGVEVRELTGWSLAYIRIRAYRARARMQKEYSKLMKSYE